MKWKQARGDQSLVLARDLGAVFAEALARFLTGETAFFALEVVALRRLPTGDLDRLWVGFFRALSALLRRLDFGGCSVSNR